MTNLYTLDDLKCPNNINTYLTQYSFFTNIFQIDRLIHELFTDNLENVEINKNRLIIINFLDKLIEHTYNLDKFNNLWLKELNSNGLFPKNKLFNKFVYNNGIYQALFIDNNKDVHLLNIVALSFIEVIDFMKYDNLNNLNELSDNNYNEIIDNFYDNNKTEWYYGINNDKTIIDKESAINFELEKCDSIEIDTLYYWENYNCFTYYLNNDLFEINPEDGRFLFDCNSIEKLKLLVLIRIELTFTTWRVVVITIILKNLQL